MSETPQPSPQALADLHDSAYRWALACCDFEEDLAREVMQMVYLEILRRRAVFDGASSLKTWLFAVVRRTSLRLATSLGRSGALQERLARLAVDAEHPDDCELGLARSQTRCAVAGALERLSPQQRQLVELVYYHDLSLADAATVMRVQVGTARQHFHRAKQALARELQPMKEALGDV
jgi:RNA polymerase sigma-70 factor (ECF subfamily)